MKRFIALIGLLAFIIILIATYQYRYAVYNFVMRALGQETVLTKVYKWNYEQFAASYRYLALGEATEGMNDLYHRQKQSFINVDDVLLSKSCPNRLLNNADFEDYAFFGARFLPLIPSKNVSDKDYSFYSVSYLGPSRHFYNQAFDHIMDPSATLLEPKRHNLIAEQGLANNYLEKYGYKDLTIDGVFKPLSWNSADIDGDGIADFTFGRSLALSSQSYSLSAELHGRYNSFLHDPKESSTGLLLSWDGRDLGVFKFDDASLNLERLAGMKIKKAKLKVQHYPMISSLFSQEVELNGNAAYSFNVMQECGRQFYSVQYDDDESTEKPYKLNKHGCLSGVEDQWSVFGAYGDFDDDGFDDFWVSMPSFSGEGASVKGKLALISGQLWQSEVIQNNRNIALEDITLFAISGHSKFSDYDGVATTLSPKAGDIDGDGLIDLSFSGHRHMNEAGALYVVSGKNIKERIGGAMDIDHPDVMKILGSLMAQIAPPYHHWDASDYNNDGHDDIVVTSNNDMCSGFNAGAIYILSGRAISKLWNAK